MHFHVTARLFSLSMLLDACHFDADPGPTFHYNAYIPYTMACHLQIDADPDHSDAHTDPAYHLCCGSRSCLSFDAESDLDPQHCSLCVGFCLRRTWQVCVLLRGPTLDSSRTNSNCSSSSANGWPPGYPPKLTLQVPSPYFYHHVCNCLSHFLSGFRIRIDLMRIRIRIWIQHFF